MSMTIEIDPHKASHTVAIDGDGHPVARLKVTTARVR